jgi:hypothetical protein
MSPSIDVFMNPFFRKNGANPPKTFATRTNRGAALEAHNISRHSGIVAGRTEPPHASGGSEYASAPQGLLCKTGLLAIDALTTAVPFGE